MPNNQRPPYILVKTWLDIYYSRQTPEHKEAQVVVETLILKNFYSVYEAEMYLFQLERPKAAQQITAHYANAQS
jgi:hypothetical protein